MSVKVNIPLSSSISASVSTGNNINTQIVSKKVTADLQTLADVDVQAAQDGYTLVYNNDTKKWEATNVNEVVATPTVINGGTY
jgi:hypothetical protein